MRLNFTFSVIVTIFYFNSFAQSDINGNTIDAVHFLPLPGVNISVNHQPVIASDKDGTFQLTRLQNGDTLKFTSVGYRELELIFFERSNYTNIQMQPLLTQLSEVIISSPNRKMRLLDEPASVAFISGKDLQRDNEIIPLNALNRVPGVYMHSGTLNTNRITIRGIGSRSLFSTNKIKAYLDDIPLTSGDGETTVEDIDLHLIDRIEIIKGPNSSIFGAGLGGTINLGTGMAGYQKTNFRSGLNVGKFGLKSITNSFRHGDDSKNISLIYSNVHFDGYRENNQYDRESVAILGKFFTGKNNVLSIFANLIDLKAYIPSSIDSATFASNPRAAAFTWQQSKGFEAYDKSIVGLSYDHVYSQQWAQKFSLFTNFRSAYEPRPFNILTENTQSIGVRSTLNYAEEEEQSGLKWTIGLEYFKDWYAWETIENNNQQPGATLSNNRERRNYLNLFTSLSYTFSEKLSVNGGLNFNTTRYDYQDLFLLDSLNQSGNYNFGSILSPRLAFLFRPNRQQSVFLNLSHGFSPPTLAETLTPEGVINPEIEPETGYNLELGSRGTWLNDRLQYDLSIYTMWVRNLLVARRVDDDQYIGVNAGKSLHNGMELQLNYLLFDQPFHSMNVFLSYLKNDYKFDEFIDDENDYSGNQLTGNPRNILNFGLDYENNMGGYIHVNGQYVDKIPINDANTIYSQAYFVMNFKIGYRQTLFKNIQFENYFGLNNFLDEKYASMLLVNATGFGTAPPRYYYPGMPRNYFFGIVLEYNFSN